MGARERQILYRCPHCGEQITRLPDDRSRYTCPRCRRRYFAMVDAESRSVAFVDESAGPVREPLGLPRGSIRGLIALSMAAACGVLVAQGRPVPTALMSLLLAIVGFYFGFRIKAAGLSDNIYDPAARREQPLHLPAGLIRLLLVLGFVAMGLVLLARGELAAGGAYVEFLLILAGLVVGHFFGKIAAAARGSWAGTVIAHAKGVLGLAVTVALAGLFLSGRQEAVAPHVVTLLCATVSFYFGSRS